MLKKFSLLSLFAAICLLGSTGCTTRKVDVHHQWTTDTNTWVDFTLAGVRLRVPPDLTLQRYQPNIVQFIIEASRYDTYLGLIPEQGISLSVKDRQGKSVDEIQKDFFTQSEGVALISKETNTPTVLFYSVGFFSSPNVHSRLLTPDSTVGATGLCAHCVTRPGKSVRLSFSKRTPSVTFTDWRPETMFTDKERALISMMAQSVTD